jgi:outer membrane lipoprotein LolB
MRVWLALLMSLVPLSCTTVPQVPPPEDPAAEWQRRQIRLAQLDYWQLTGRLAIRLGEEGGNARMRWIQSQNTYDISLTAPLGQGMVRLSGNESSVTLRPSKGEVVTGAKPGELLETYLGWTVPIDQLRYWIVGLTGSAADYGLDAFGRVKTLQHQGWAVNFVEYNRVGDAELPGVLYLRSQDLRLRLAVDSWNLQKSGATGGARIPVPLDRDQPLQKLF